MYLYPRLEVTGNLPVWSLYILCFRSTTLEILMRALLGSRRNSFQEGLWFKLGRLITLKFLPFVAFNCIFHFGRYISGQALL